MKKLASILLTLLLFAFAIKPTFAQEKEVNVYFFWGVGCPHCSLEKPFLEKLEVEYPEVNVYDFEIWNSKENLEFLIEVGKTLEINVSGVPLTVIGEKHITGWLSEETTGVIIEEYVQDALENGHRDTVGEILIPQPEVQENTQPPVKEEQTSVIPEKISLPFFGEIYTKNFSLPILTIVLGGLDGFNPCAMWTLLFLISLLLGMEDKKRRWILGTAFIAASAFVYFLFMSAWLNLLLFVGFIVWVRILIGLVALGGGGYNLREYILNKDEGCKVTGGEKRQAVFEKLKSITHRKQFFLALGGIILLAFAVNLVELICSAGLPVIFTQILSLSGISEFQRYLYMLLYVFVFMLDDLFIFFIAMTTLEMTGISTKYTRISHLIGGILMFIIGLLLIFKPELLMFG